MGLVVLLAACAPGANTAVVPRPEGAGFWLGVWHGLVAPVTFVVSLFSDRVGMYAVRNVGHLYDLGFLIGLSIGFGVFAGPGRVARRRRREGATR